jgi:uncharacterized protein
MFQREVLIKLEKWAAKTNRKPLVLRGARQVGKTSVVNQFSASFDQFIHLNLDKDNEKIFFDRFHDVHQFFDAVCLNKKITPGKGKILLFIDEIQNSPAAVAMLRYFYEEIPGLFVIAAGSLLETLIGKKISFPVGRVEFLPVRPCSFPEFLAATGEEKSIELLMQIPFPEFGHSHLLDKFKTFAFTGGMPEVVDLFSKERSLAVLNPVYDALVVSYLDDVEKYARNETLNHVIRHIIRNSFNAAATRITFQGFGNSQYKNREMSEAFKTLEKTFLFQLIYPANETRIPLNPNYKRSPKLQIVDTGLVNYMAGLQSGLIETENLSSAYAGKIAEHITAQELLCLSDSVLFKLNYWSREDKDASAEVDFVWQYQDLLIPIEVKSGKAGKLRSLHQYIDRAPHPWSVRVYSGSFGIEITQTLSGKRFYLMNLPFYLVNKLPEYLDYLTKSYSKKELY